MQVIEMERYSSQTGNIVHRLTVKPNYNAASIILVNHHATNFEGKKKQQKHQKVKLHTHVGTHRKVLYINNWNGEALIVG